MKRCVTFLPVSLLVGWATLTEAYPDIRARVPNGRNVLLNGQLVKGLGHANAQATSASTGDANPFGLQAIQFYNQGGAAFDAMWDAICDTDPDGDGLTNGAELCDPDCQWRFETDEGKDPDCPPGFALSHPGFAGDDAGGIPAYVKAHAAMMIIAWLFLAPIGILMATTMKKNSSGSVTWFKTHRAAMVTATICTLVGFLIMVSEVGFALNATHQKLGITVLIFAFLQPLSGVLRPHNPPKNEAKSTNRLLWEMQHQWTGRTTVVIAVGAIITGLELGFGANDTTRGGSIFLAALLALVGAGSFAYVFLVRDKNLPPKQLPSGHRHTAGDDEKLGGLDEEENPMAGGLSVKEVREEEAQKEADTTKMEEDEAAAEKREDMVVGEVVESDAGDSEAPKRDFNDFSV